MLVLIQLSLTRFWTHWCFLPEPIPWRWPETPSFQNTRSVDQTASWLFPLPSLTHAFIYTSYGPTDSWLAGGDIISGIIPMPVLSQDCIRHPFVGCYVLPASYHLSLRTPLCSGTRYTKLTLHIPCLSRRTRHFFKDSWFLLAETGVSKPKSVGEESSPWVITASWPVP